MKIKYNILSILLIMTISLPMVGILSSCSESDDTVEEFTDWKNKNDKYFSALFADAQKKTAAGDTNWKIIKNWSLPATGEGFIPDAEDCIVAEVLKKGNGDVCPLYSDNVKIHYLGRLIPSTTYSGGMVFDRSYTGTFNETTAAPTTMKVSGVVDGFATALQNMHEGDQWRVYIPYQLGYGSTQSSSSVIPAYSTLIFDITLVKIEK